MSRDEKLHSNATTSSSKLTSKPFSKISQKFRSAGQPAGPTSRMLGNRYSPNPQDTTTDPFVPAPRFPEKRKLDENDRSSVSDNDDSVHSNDEKLKPAPGKKTRGRVKIQMEYIQNKLRRYTTFSKRKSGIMKKAYELSTLTGTQVMLLVASETGHVYTFATPKLQPMITSEAGKALIQTCLHSPEPAPAISSVGDYDMRMNVSGYEETELGYNMSDEDFKHNMNNCVVSGSSQMTAVLNPVVSIPQQMMQIPFSGQEAHSMASNYVMTPSHPIQPVQPMASSAQVLSPHHSPPSYSPPLQPTTSPSTYTPPYPGSPSYSQASHMPPQPVMLDELGSPSHISGSPLRKSPEHHYLGTHGMDGYDRSPSRSPIQNRYGSPHMYSAPTSSPPMSGHSPLRQL